VLFAALLGYAPAAPPQVAPAAASHLLGPNFRYRTTLHGTGPIRNRTLHGDLVADQSAWDTVHVHCDWSNYDLLRWYAAPTGALGFNDNAVDFQVRPGGAVGDPARITAAPQLVGPVLLTSQNWYAEQLLKTLGKERRGREFLTRVVGIESLAFVLCDASGLSAYNLITPHALVQIDVVKTIATGDLQ
jgi:D-alanyl-D-alanine carboxypeptidase